MAGHYVLSKSNNGQFNFVLKAGNGETILQSEQYTTKAAAEGGIASVRSNCAAEERYERKDASSGDCYFVLKAANHQTIGASEMYKSRSGRDGGIESVKANGASTTVKDLTAS